MFSVAIHLFELSQHPSVIASHKLDETAQCELFRAACNGLVGSQANVFPNLRSITLGVSLHAKKMISDAPNNPLNRCGITFNVGIKLGRKSCATRTDHYNASLPKIGSVIQNPFLLQHAKYEPHNQSLHLNTLNDPSGTPISDPRRLMLSPLRQLLGVQSVEVERRWTVCYRQQDIEDGTLVMRAQPLRKLWQFLTVDEMLERAGPGFDEFLDPALEHLKIDRKDVVEIIENSTEDLEYRLIP